MALPVARIVERGAIVACGLVPLVGLFFLGWSTATVIYLLWLDAYLASMRMIPANMYLLANDAIQRAVAPAGRAIVALEWVMRLGVAWFLWVFVSAPIQIAGTHLDNMVSRFHPGGFEAEFHDLLATAPWSFAIFVGCRLVQGATEFRAARAAGRARFVEIIKPIYKLLLFKGLVLFALAGFAALLAFFSRTVLAGFVVMAVLALIAAELYAERWFHAPPPGSGPIPPPDNPVDVVHGFDARR